MNFLFPAFRLWSFISSKRKFQILALLVLMLISSIVELASIGAVLPFLGVLTDPGRIFQSPHITPVLSAFNISNPTQLILPICLLFGGIILLANSCRLVTFWMTTRLSYGIGLELGVDIYKNILSQPYSFHLKRNSGEIIGVVGRSSDIVSSKYCHY